MPTFRARCTRALLRQTVGRMYRRAGGDLRELRRLDGTLIRSQRPPKGTQVSRVRANGLSGEWILGPWADSDAAILHLHGGAFVSGSPATHRELVARISRAAGMRAFSPDFRLAPEHPFPAALEDTLTAYRWLLDQGHSPQRVVLGGESSGGGLALQGLLAMKEERIPLPGAAFFLSPVTDWIDLGGESYRSRAGRDPLLSPTQCRSTASHYVGANPPDTPLLRPAEMDLAGLPPLWIQVGDYEVLLSDARRLANRAAEAGVEVDFTVWPGLWHVFQAAARWVPEGRESLEELGRFLRKHVGATPAGGTQG